MDRDIDRIIEGVRRRFPNLVIWQLKVSNPADDDGLWFFTLPGKKDDIQIESSSGMCPFVMEHCDMKSSTEAWHAHSVEEVVDKISSYLNILATRQ
jgi:hypothetical protein